MKTSKTYDIMDKFSFFIIRATADTLIYQTVTLVFTNFTWYGLQKCPRFYPSTFVCSCFCPKIQFLLFGQFTVFEIQVYRSLESAFPTFFLKRFSFITQFRITFLQLFTSYRKVLGKMPDVKVENSYFSIFSLLYKRFSLKNVEGSWHYKDTCFQ